MTEDKTDTLKENAKDVQDNYINLPVGEILRRVRLQHNLGLSQVEANTRIKATYIEALELGDLERLPGQVYVVGFVKVYSEYLGLDPVRMVQLLKKQTGHKVTRPANIFHVTTEDQKVPSLRIIIASVVVLVLVLLAWKLGNPTLQNDDIPAVPKELAQQMTAPQKPVEEVATPQTATEESVKPKVHPVVLKAVQDVWLEIRDGAGQPIFSRVLKTGEEYWVPEEAADYKMTTGNAGGLNVIVDGVLLPALGAVGEVKRNVSINPYDLKGEAAPVPAATPVPDPAPAPVAVTTPAILPEAAPVQPIVEASPVITAEPAVEPVPEVQPKPKRKRLAEPTPVTPKPAPPVRGPRFNQ